MTDINEVRKITLDELLLNNGEDNKPLWVMIHGKIYDLTNFKHPGGRDVLENDEDDKYVDKGKEFDSVGHPPAVNNQMKEFLIGEFDKTSKKPVKLSENNSNVNSQESASGYGGVNFVLIFFVISGIALALAYALGKI